MGEIAELMLNGILGANGEYTGHNYGRPIRQRGLFKKRSQDPYMGILLFIQGGRNVSRQISRKYVRKYLIEYAEKIEFPKIGNHQLAENWDREISYVIQKDFLSFKNWYNNLKK